MTVNVRTVTPASNEGRAHRAAVDLDRVGWTDGVTSGECDGHGQVSVSGGLQDELVTLPQTLSRQGQASELISLVGVGSSQVDDELRPVIVQNARKMLREEGQVLLRHPPRPRVRHRDLQQA